MKISVLLFLSLVTLSTSGKGKKGTRYTTITTTTTTAKQEQQLQFCKEGQYRSYNHTCLPCHKGEFMAEAVHTNEQCLPCSQCKFMGMQTIKPCTRSSDAQCCPLPGMIVVDKARQEKDSLSCVPDTGNRDFCCCEIGYSLRGSRCIDNYKHDDSFDLSAQRMVSKSCGINQYLDEKTQACRPCEKCTYQNLTEHVEKQCKACSTNNPRLAYCPDICLHKTTNVVLRLVISGLIVVVFPAVLVPLSLAIVSVAKTYNWI